MSAVIIIIPVIVLLVWLWYLKGAGNTLRVLMYHKVDESISGRHTVTQQQLRQQVEWLIRHNYKIISFKELKQLSDSNRMSKGKYVILTFDDAYENNFTYALPVLQQYNTKATIFIPTSFIGGVNAWENGNEKIMDADQLRQLPRQHTELGLHTHTHANFIHGIEDMIKSEMEQSIATLQQLKIPFVPVFAYAYGAHPKNKTALLNMFGILSRTGIWYALKIGNSINPLPLQQQYMIKRIDIRGDESFFTFKLKIWFGKIRL